MKSCLTILFLFFGLITFGQDFELIVPVGHVQEVNTSVYSPNGLYILTSSNDKTAKLWNAKDGRLLKEYIHNDGVTSANFSPKTFSDPEGGSRIVTASCDGVVRIWNTADATVIKEITGHKDWVSYATFSPDGSKIATASWDFTVKIWDATAGKLWGTLTNSSKSFCANFSPDGKLLVTTAQDGVANITDLVKMEHVRMLEGHTSNIIYASFSPDGKNILTASADKTARVWKVSNGKMVHELKLHREPVFCANYSADGKHIVTSSLDNNAIIWNTATWEVEQILKGHTQNVSFAAFSPDGKNVVTASWDYTGRVWNVIDGNTIFELKGKGTRVFSGIYSPDGKNIVTASGDRTAKVWNVADGKLLFELKGHKKDVGSAVYSHDGKFIITSSGDATAKIWNAKNGVLIRTIDADNGAMHYAEFNATGDLIVTGSADKVAQIWNASNGKLLHNLSSHMDMVYEVHFSPDGTKIISASGDNTAKVWNVSDGKELFELDGHSDIVLSANFSPDGKTIITGSFDNTAIIWNAEDGKKIMVLKGHTDRIKSASFSPDGSIILTASMDGSARLWDAKSGNVIREMKSKTGGLYSASFSPVTPLDPKGGKNIITTSDNNTCKVWNAATGELEYTFFSFDGTEYIIQIPSGYYACSPNAARTLYYVDHLDILSFAQLDVKYNRPDLVLRNIENSDVAMIDAYHSAYIKRITKLGIDSSSFAAGFSFPVVNYISPPVYEQKTQKISLHIHAEDKTNNLDHFQLWINDNPIWGQKGIVIKTKDTHIFDTIVEVILSDGENRIETSVINTGGIESFRSLVNVKYTPIHPAIAKTYFIGIGIDHFKDARYNLTWSSKDIRDMALALKAKEGENLIVDTLFNENVTVENVRALKARLKSAGVNDKVIIAYSGHGMLSSNFDYYLSTYNINFDKPEQGGLAYEEFENLLDSIPARQKLMMIDACHSGEVDKDEMTHITSVSKDSSLHLAAARGPLLIYNTSTPKLGTKNSFELMSDLFVNVSKGTGATVIAAASGTQFALETNELQNGVFTFCFLQMLKSKDTCSVQELKKNISDEVERRTNGAQRPTSRSETSNFDWNVW